MTTQGWRGKTANTQREFKGVIPAGTKGVCGSPYSCAIAQHIKNHMGATNPRVGIETMSFAIGETRYTVSTPLDLRILQHELDKQAKDGKVEETCEDVAFNIKLTGPGVEAKPVRHMTVEEKAKLKASRRQTREEKDEANAHARAYKAKLKARLS